MSERSQRERRITRITKPRALTVLLFLSTLFGGCYRVPAAIKLYAADLPARADGQYAMIDDDMIKKSLVTKDAMLQCNIDEEDKPGETSPACTCAKATSPDWTVDCKAWLGDHTPKKHTEPAIAPTANPAPTLPPMSSAGTPSTPN